MKPRKKGAFSPCSLPFLHYLFKHFSSSGRGFGILGPRICGIVAYPGSKKGTVTRVVSPFYTYLFTHPSSSRGLVVGQYRTIKYVPQGLPYMNLEVGTPNSHGDFRANSV